MTNLNYYDDLCIRYLLTKKKGFELKQQKKTINKPSSEVIYS